MAGLDTECRFTEGKFPSRVVHGVRSAVDGADERIFLRGVEAGRLARGDVRDAGAIPGPDRAAPLHEEAVARSVGVHHPELRLPPVVQLLDVAAEVDHLPTVAGKLRRADVLEVEVLGKGKAVALDAG